MADSQTADLAEMAKFWRGWTVLDCKTVRRLGHWYSSLLVLWYCLSNRAKSLRHCVFPGGHPSKY
jgi:hypothetical protein